MPFRPHRRNAWQKKASLLPDNSPMLLLYRVLLGSESLGPSACTFRFFDVPPSICNRFFGGYTASFATIILIEATLDLLSPFFIPLGPGELRLQFIDQAA